jgi:hypothetical protein
MKEEDDVEHKEDAVEEGVVEQEENIVEKVWEIQEVPNKGVQEVDEDDDVIHRINGDVVDVRDITHSPSNYFS